MTTLADFETEGVPDRESTQARCRAVTGTGARCPGPAEKDSLCGFHDEHEPTTIDDGPRELITATSGTEWRDFDHDLVRAAVRNREFELEFGDGGSE